MVIVASYTTVRNVELKMKILFLPVILSFTIANLSMLLYFSKFVLDLENLLEARYLIPIGGMILGNSLSGNVVGIGGVLCRYKKERKQVPLQSFPRGKPIRSPPALYS